jgi:hypothetical protein
VRRAGLCIVLASTACPALHDLTGRSCTADSECGDGLVCHRGTCAKAGSFETIPVDLASSASTEGGVDATRTALSRAATQPGLGVLTSAAATPRAQAAAAGPYVLGGGTDDVTELLSGKAVTKLPSARSALAAAWAPGRLYALGGHSLDSTLLTDVLSAAVLADGGLGSWSNETALPSARHGLSAVAAGGFVYAIGGETAAGLTSDLLAAPIKADGALGAWAPAGRLPNGRARAGAAMFDNRLYVVAGSCDGPACAPLRFDLLSDGGFGPAQTLADLPQRESAAVAIAGGALHVLGGRQSDGTVLDEVWSLALNETGTADWLPQPALATPLYGAVAATVPGGLSVLGGFGADGGLLGQQLTGAATGSGIGPWDEGPLLQDDVQLSVSVVWNGAIYVLGGLNNGGPYDTISRAEPASDGGLTGWTIAGHTPAAGASFGALAWGGRLYLVGGCGNGGAGDCLSIDDVAVADFLHDGGVGTFAGIGHLTMDAEGPVVSVVNGALYAVGGVSGYQPTLPYVLKASLDPMSDTLGTFGMLAPLPVDPGLLGHGMIASRGVLYVVGGQTEGGYGGYRPDVLLGPLAADGSVNGWSTASAALPEERSMMQAAGFDDFLYAVGGCNEQGQNPYCGNMLTNVPVAAILEDGGLSSFAQSAGDLPRPRKMMSTAVLNGRVIVTNGYDGNPHDWSDLGRLHGRGQLGPGQAIPPADGPLFAAGGGWVFSLGASVQQAPARGDWMPATGPGGTVTAVAATDAFLSAAAGTVYSSAPITASGLGPWTTLAAAIPQAATAMAATATATYVLAGADVFVLSKGAWKAGPPMPAPVQQALVARGHLFAIGGPSGDIFVSAIAADDSLGEWRRADGIPGGPRTHFGAVASDELLYVGGGDGFSDVMAAPIHQDGALGTWSTVGSRTPASALAVSGGWLLALGPNPTARPLLTPPARGVVAVRVDLGNVVTLDDVQLTATGAATTDVRLAGADGTFADWQPLAQALGKPARGVWLRITLSENATVTSVSVSTQLNRSP